MVRRPCTGAWTMSVVGNKYSGVIMETYQTQSRQMSISLSDCDCPVHSCKVSNLPFRSVSHLPVDNCKLCRNVTSKTNHALVSGFVNFAVKRASHPITLLHRQSMQMTPLMLIITQNVVISQSSHLGAPYYSRLLCLYNAYALREPFIQLTM